METLPEAFDRRSANRDAASWVRSALEEQSQQIRAARSDLVINTQHIENQVAQVDKKVEDLHIALKEAFIGSPEDHKQDHKDIAIERTERQERTKDWHDFFKKLKFGFIASVIGLIGFLISLGAVDWARNFVFGVEQGKSSMELREGKPITGKEGRELRFNR